jgi:hypothetical protein
MRLRVRAWMPCIAFRILDNGEYAHDDCIPVLVSVMSDQYR